MSTIDHFILLLLAAVLVWKDGNPSWQSAFYFCLALVVVVWAAIAGP